MPEKLLDVDPWRHNVKVLELIASNVLTPTEGWKLFIDPEVCTARYRAYPWRKAPAGAERWHYDVFPPIEQPEPDLEWPRYGPYKNSTKGQQPQLPSNNLNSFFTTAYVLDPGRAQQQQQ